MSITEEIEHGEITEDGDYHRLEKISQRLIDKNSFNEWCHGLEKKSNALARMTVNISNTPISLV